MLKWAVMARRDASEKPDVGRRLSLNPTTNIKIATENAVLTPSSSKQRRRSSATNRRSSGAAPSSRRRSSILRRNSLGLEADKENQFTSTPIKSCEDNLLHSPFDALRDVSNLTPKDTVQRRRRRDSSPGSASKKHKKKKLCLDPDHGGKKFTLIPEKSGNNKNYFRPFESVDSHIEGLLEPQELNLGSNVGMASTKRPPQTPYYAPTLPTFNFLDYSPCLMPVHPFLNTLQKNLGTSSSQSLKNSAQNALPVSENPRNGILNSKNSGNNGLLTKGPKIDHVNDFLNQISHVMSSPEEDHRAKFHLLEVKSNSKIPSHNSAENNQKASCQSNSKIPSEVPSHKEDEIKVSPLVRKFVDLNFSHINCCNNPVGRNSPVGPARKLVLDKNHWKSDKDSSSFIDDLSLEQIVDAILDSTVESVQMHQNDKCGSPAGRGQNDSNFSMAVHLDDADECGRRDNELNETEEENLVNRENERQTLVMGSFDRCSSSDSGFRSSATTENNFNPHRLDHNFKCVQCKNKNELPGGTGNFFQKTSVNSEKPLGKNSQVNNLCEPQSEVILNSDITIITINETFNERCVDDDVTSLNPSSTKPCIRPSSEKPGSTVRKRRSSSPLFSDTDLGNNGKSKKRFFSMNSKNFLPANFTLKRQKCIRRRKTDEDGKLSSTKKKPVFLTTDGNHAKTGTGHPKSSGVNVKCPESPLMHGFFKPQSNLMELEQLLSNDDSFESPDISGKVSDYNKSTPLKSGEKPQQQNGATEKPEIPASEVWIENGNATTRNKMYLEETYTLPAVTPTSDVHNSRRFRRCLLFESPSSEISENSASSLGTNCSIGDVRGTMDLNLKWEDGHLYVNVIRCSNLYRPGGKQINAYVKVFLSDRLMNSNRRKRTGLLQRTPVQSESNRPFFNHTFKFALPQEEKENSQRRLQIEVWHRDRVSRTSEFLGCMSFDARNAYKKEISGTYRLLPQSTGRTQNVPASATTVTTSITSSDVTFLRTTSNDHSKSLTAGGQHYPPSMDPPPNNNTCGEESCQSKTSQHPLTMDPSSNQNNMVTMACGEESCQSSMDEIMSLEDLEQDLNKKNPQTNNKAILSEQQKYADENLFLRYLELDPLEGPDAIPAATQRKATGNKHGRTPFTHTKKLARAPKSGFGFSVVWTHPPRIERVEKGLPAEKAGILPGDYIIFVDKHNVVMMPEIDILNLIRSYGSQLTLEIFRRNPSRNGSVPSVRRMNSNTSGAGISLGSTTGLPALLLASTCCSGTNNLTTNNPNNLNLANPPVSITNQQQALLRRPSTVCSTINTAGSTVDNNYGDRGGAERGGDRGVMINVGGGGGQNSTARRKLHLPQVTFSAEKPASNNQDEHRKKVMYQLISKEQQYATGLQFAIARFVSALAERRDLITPSEHRSLFQNSEEILRITEDILDILMPDNEPHTHLLVRTYHAKLPELIQAYKRYCSGIKRADCVLANKTKNSNSEFVRFIHTPAIPRRRPDITTFIHKPLEHFREILKLLTVLQSHTKSNHEDFPVINQVVHDLQITYREITAEAGLMEPMGEGRPLLTVQDLENRLVFTKCKPFVLNKPGRQWIFGGDLGRVEGRNVRQYWTLLFSDLLLFAKVSRDRVLFVMEDPLPLAHISDMFFNVRKKETEFRLTINPLGRKATSPTVHCGPDLSRTPKKNASKRLVVLRAPTAELKAVWQNLLQRQIFHVNSSMTSSASAAGDGCCGSSFTSQSPLDLAYSEASASPLDVPIGNSNMISSSMATTLQSAESLSFTQHTLLRHHHHHSNNQHNRQVRLYSGQPLDYSNLGPKSQDPNCSSSNDAVFGVRLREDSDPYFDSLDCSQKGDSRGTTDNALFGEYSQIPARTCQNTSKPSGTTTNCARPWPSNLFEKPGPQESSYTNFSYSQLPPNTCDDSDNSNFVRRNLYSQHTNTSRVSRESTHYLTNPVYSHLPPSSRLLPDNSTTFGGEFGEPDQRSTIPSLPLKSTNTPNSCSLTKTPDTPSANISSSPSPKSSKSSQFDENDEDLPVSLAFTSHFTSQTSLVLAPPDNNLSPDEAPSPSAILTPSTETETSDNAALGDCAEDEVDFFENFDQDPWEPWDISNFDYDLSCLNIDGLSTKSCQST